MLGGGGFVASNPLFEIKYQGFYGASLPAGVTAIATNRVDYWKAGPLFLGIGKLSTSSGTAGSGDLTVSLPNGLMWDTTAIASGATTSNQGAAVLGFAQLFIQGGGWKFAYPNYLGSTQVFFVENTQHIAANELTTGDSLSYWLMGPISGWL